MRCLLFRSARSFDWCADVAILPFQLDAISLTRNLKSDTSATVRLLFIALVPCFSTGPTSSPRSFVSRHRGSKSFLVAARARLGPLHSSKLLEMVYRFSGMPSIETGRREMMEMEMESEEAVQVRMVIEASASSECESAHKRRQRA
jgi:hypothetical protein